MELIYSMRRKPLKCEPPHFESTSDPDVIRPLCTISSCNIIAFTSPTDLSDSEGDTWGGHVYVCDLDTPWDIHLVTATVEPVSTIEWDSEGKQLLVATAVGDVSVFAQKDYLLNEWTCLYTACFPGEVVLTGAFFHVGRRALHVSLQKGDALVAERVQVLRPTPTLKGFGGVACEGACIVTGSGLVGALTAPTAAPAASTTPPTAPTAACALRAARDRVSAAAIQHKNGGLVVAAAWRGCVRAYAVSVSAGPALALQPLPTIHLEDNTPAPAPPSSLAWCLREDTDSLLVAGSKLTLYKLTERSHPVHKLFSKGPVQGSTTPTNQKPASDCFNTVVWQLTAAWSVESGARGLCVASCRLTTATSAVCATPRALLLVHRDKHHAICTTPVVTSVGVGSEAGSSPPKKGKYSPGNTSCAVVCCCDMSWLGSVAVCVDTHAQLHVFAVNAHAHARDIPNALSIQHTTSLLEYAMVTGYDCLDLLLTLKQNMVEPVYEKFTENFQRQPQPFQQYYYNSWLKLRIAISRLSSASADRTSWLMCVLMLQAVWAHCTLSLRVEDRAAPDLAPLQALLHDHEPVEKALAALEGKPELPLSGSLLQALQLQRAQHAAHSVILAAARPGTPNTYEIYNDSAALLLIRKLAALSCAAGRGSEQRARMLARLALALAGPGGASHLKHELAEECGALVAQSSSPRVWECAPRCAVSVPHAPHHRPWPLHLEYGVEPDALKFAPEPPAYAQCDTQCVPTLAMDSIRYMFLGGGSRPAKWRQCCRCGARAFAASQPAKHPVQRAYDARFLSACRCSGKWTLFSNV